MKPYYEDDAVTLWHGDCLDVLRTMPDASVDSVVCDPPYGLGFMGREWDDLPPGLPWAIECLRVLKPGGHLLAFGGSRTWHRLAVAVEDAGFEVRDSIAWLYGSGFPKSLDVSKAIDKAAGATRETIAGGSTSCPDFPTPCEGHPTANGSLGGGVMRHALPTSAATEAAIRWQGWGTALKPAFEPIVVARKPLAGTVAANVLAHGTGALNVDGCRVATPDGKPAWDYPDGAGGHTFKWNEEANQHGAKTGPAGRWPTNVILDESQAAALDQQSGTLKSGKMLPTHTDAGRNTYGQNAAGGYTTMETYGDTGGASRFFPTFRYQAKAPTRERPSYEKPGADGSVAGSPATSGRRCNVCGNQTVPKGGKPWPACGHDDWSRFETENRTAGKVAHPTVKPLELMRWLVRLVTPPGGLVLEPFAGSGTTVEAAILEGFQCIAIEREADYLPLIRARIDRNRHTADGLPAAAEALALFDFEEPA